jgi:hypothetical protein
LVATRGSGLDYGWDVRGAAPSVTEGIGGV